MSDLLLDGLREVISSSYPDTPGAHFAYVGLPPCRDPQRDLVQILEEIIRPQSMSILLVTNAYEAYAHEQSHRSQRTSVITFAKFLSALESSLNADGWVSRTHGERRSCLPRDAFIVMDLDPSLPVDCALGLLGLIQWAIGIEASHSMPILISSIAEHYELVTDLVHTGDPSREVPITNLWETNEYQYLPVTHRREPDGEESFLDAIYKDIEANPNKTQLIISFGPVDLADQLQGYLESLREATCRFIDVGDWSYEFPAFEEVRSPPPNVTAVMIMVPPNITILPPCFSGYDSVHVILEGQWVDSRTWHDKVSEVAQFMRILPTQHRWMQLWWAAQPGCGETSLWSRRESLDEFMENGHDDHYLIDGVQLGGFVASVYDAERWGIDPSRTLYHFVGLGDRVNIMIQRLETQGVLSRGRFSLQGKEASTFRKMLPLVAYDHCAALFICLDADPVTCSVKIDLAVLLTDGLQLLDVKDRGILAELRATDSLFNKLVKCCMGYAKSMAANGPMWLELGLWNRVRCLEICPTTYRLSSQKHHQSEWNGTFASKLGLSRIALVELERRRADLRIAIGSQAVTSDEQDMRAFDNGSEFDMIQQNRIQGQLFRAYMYHASLSHGTAHAFQFNMEHCLLASQLPVKRLPSPFAVGQAFSVTSLLNVEGTPLPYICINPDLRVKNRVVYSWNWALMPVDVIEDWMEANDSNGDLVATLLVRNNGQREDVCEVVDEE